jgi:hypothetical protein
MTRAQLESHWLQLLDGQVSRAESHAWADPRRVVAEPSEPLVMAGLQILHTATGAEPAPLRTDLARLLEAWRADCAAYDADPPGWRRQNAIATLRGLNRDHPERAPAAALVYLREGILSEEEIRAAVERPD